MKNSKKATSILEAVIITLIISMWVVWMYSIYMESNDLTDSLANRIQAIQIAREWIEAMTNIRDTNWQKYWADYKNCWNTYNYDISCIWVTNWTTTDIPNWSWWYIIYTDSNNKWVMENYPNTWSYANTAYKSNFRVWLDTEWFYTQTWTTTNLVPLFTREIQIDYINTTWAIIDSNDEQMKITSLVQWMDRSSENVHKVEFDTVLSNWKNQKQF